MLCCVSKDKVTEATQFNILTTKNFISNREMLFLHRNSVFQPVFWKSILFSNVLAQDTDGSDLVLF